MADQAADYAVIAACTAVPTSAHGLVRSMRTVTSSPGAATPAQRSRDASLTSL